MCVRELAVFRNFFRSYKIQVSTSKDVPCFVSHIDQLQFTQRELSLFTTCNELLGVRSKPCWARLFKNTYLEFKLNGSRRIEEKPLDPFLRYGYKLASLAQKGHANSTWLTWIKVPNRSQVEQIGRVLAYAWNLNQLSVSDNDGLMNLPAIRVGKFTGIFPT